MMRINPHSAHAMLRSVFDGFDASDGLAYRHVDGDLSFKGLRTAALDLAERLAVDGTSPVLICGHKHRHFLVAYWAALLSGRAAVPVEPSTAPERLAQIAQVSQAGVVLLADEALDGQAIANLPVWPVWEESCARGHIRMDYCSLGPESALPTEIPTMARPMSSSPRERPARRKGSQCPMPMWRTSSLGCRCCSMVWSPCIE